MPWHKVTLTIEQTAMGEGLKLRNQFLQLFTAASMPKEMALFAGTTGIPGTTFYFSPGSHEHAKSLISSYSGEPCETPNEKSLAFLAGHDTAREDLF
ncbi:MAG: hypothetical protein HWN68_09540 [Desulfobacterales bacterium]|nr:hypothetical protein [Desulfobacterales bacterium]